MISVSCTCGRRFKAEDHHAGKRTRCPVCGSLLTIPQAGGPAGVNDNGEVPSWWFPTSSASKSSSGSGTVPPTRSGSNPDDIQTVILPPKSGSQTDVPGPGGRSTDRGPGTPKRLVAVAAGVVLLAVSGIALISWLGRDGDQARIAAPPTNRSTPPEEQGTPPAEVADINPARPAPAGAGDATAGALPRTAAEPGLQLLIPAYFYPSGDGLKAWQRLTEAAGKVRIVTIANPANGPGEQRNPDYFLVTHDASDRGIRVIGYVSTDYGKRPLSEVKNEIERWVEFYPHIRGFFIDQQSAVARDIDYYLKVRDHARQQIKGALIVTNPGVMCDEQFFVQNVADAICVFANFQGFSQFEAPAVLRPFGPNRFAALAYNIPTAPAMHSVVEAAVRKRIGYLYVGDSPQGTNPYAKLPAYWDDLVTTVATSK